MKELLKDVQDAIGNEFTHKNLADIIWALSVDSRMREMFDKEVNKVRDEFNKEMNAMNADEM